MRETIFCANSQVGIDTISFDIPGVGPHIIQILSPLPQITEGVIIDGYTQGQGTPGDTSDDAVPNSNPVGQGLNMQLKIALDGEISRSTIDTNGFTLTPSAGGSVIRGLAIYNCDFGIVIEEAQANRIEGNIIGLDISGTVERRNREDGIRLFNASDNTIGGLEPDERNLVSENLNGVFITGASSTGHLVQGNLIGTDTTGMLAMGNGEPAMAAVD